MTQAILLGAGNGSRLDSERGTGPKWMLEVQGQAIAQHLVNVLHAHDVAEVLIVRGAAGGSVLSPSVRYLDVTETPNMLNTLFEVRNEVHDDVIIVYCDLLLEPKVIATALAYSGDAGIVIDRDWLNLFRLRDKAPLSIAESCRLESGHLMEIGQPILNGEIPEGQYLGVMRFSKKMFDKIMKLYVSLQTQIASGPWRNSQTFKAAYFTDFLQELIERKLTIDAVCVRGGWLEFDTPKDLEVARRLVDDSENCIFNFKMLPSLPSVLSAGGVAVRQNGGNEEVLLVGSGNDGEWRIPKGMLESGESINSAACREVYEETGVKVGTDSLVDREEWTYNYRGYKWHEQCYFYKLLVEQNSQPSPDSEHDVAAWISSSSALLGMQYVEERNALKKVLLRK